MVKRELDLWHETWERAGSQGLDTWYDMRGRLIDDNELCSGLGSNVDGLDGTAGTPSEAAARVNER